MRQILKKYTGRRIIVLMGLTLMIMLKLGMMIRATGPLISDDEIDYISNARVLVGQGELYPEAYQIITPWGYSAILVPIVKLIPNVFWEYKGYLLVNIFLGLWSWWLIYQILRSITKDVYFSLIIAFLLSWHPVFWVYQNYVLTENLYIPLQLLFIYLAIKIVKSTNFYQVVLMATTTAAIYFTRKNGFINFPIGLMVLFLAGDKRKNMAKIEMILTYILVLLCWWGLGHFVDNHWLYGQRSIEAGLLGERINIRAWLERCWQYFWGMMMYLNFGSMGGLVLSGVVLVRAGYRKLKFKCQEISDQDWIIWGSVVALFGMNLATAIIFLSSRDWVQGDYYVYGRYGEALLFPFLVVSTGLIHNLCQNRVEWGGKRILSLGLGVVLVGLVLSVTVYPWEKIENLNGLNIPSMYFYWDMFRYNREFLIILTVGANGLLMAIFYGWVKKNKVIQWITGALIVAGWSFQWSYHYLKYTRVGMVAVGQRHLIVDYLDRNNIRPETICYDKQTFDSGSFYRYFFYLRDWKVKIVDGTVGAKSSDCRWVISGQSKGWPESGYQLLALENHYRQGLWQKNGGAESVNVIDLKKIESDFGDENYRSVIKILSVKREKNWVVTNLEVSNLGHKVWLNRNSMVAWGIWNKGFVCLNQVVKSKSEEVYQERCDLEFPVYPSEVRRVKCYLNRKQAGNEISKIEYYLTHEGVAHFINRGDKSVTVEW